MRRIRLRLLCLVLFLLLPIPARAFDAERLLNDIWEEVPRRFYDGRLHGINWDEARKKYLPRVRKATSRRQVYRILNEMLAELRASHTQVVPREVFELAYGPEFRDKANRRYGFELLERNGRFYCRLVLEGGPAAKAGLLRGDEIVRIGGVRPLEWPHLWAMGDAGGGDRHYVIRPGIETALTLDIRRQEQGKTRQLRIRAARWNRTLASLASRRVIRRDGRRYLYLHLHHLLDRDLLVALRDACREVEEDGLILDLRGWGGSSRIANRLVRYLSGYPFPLVVLTDEETRSAKEVVTYHLKKGEPIILGRKTAGAVLGVGFFPIRDEAVLLLPIMDVAWLTDGIRLEGRGVHPDIRVEEALPYAAGRDRLTERAIDLLETILNPDPNGTRPWSF